MCVHSNNNLGDNTLYPVLNTVCLTFRTHDTFSIQNRTQPDWMGPIVTRFFVTIVKPVLLPILEVADDSDINFAENNLSSWAPNLASGKAKRKAKRQGRRRRRKTQEIHATPVQHNPSTSTIPWCLSPHIQIMKINILNLKTRRVYPVFPSIKAQNRIVLLSDRGPFQPFQPQHQKRIVELTFILSLKLYMRMASHPRRNPSRLN